MSAYSVSVNEGETITITITTDIAPVVDLSVPYTISGTGITSADYTLIGATGAAVVLPMGQESVALMLTAADDTDAAETLTFTLSSGIDHLVSASDGASSVTINPAGTPTIEFTAGVQTVHENAGTVTVAVRLSASPADDLVIPVRTTNRTAMAGADYTALTTDLTYTAGALGAALTQTVSIPITDDDLDEYDEIFVVNFGSLPPGIVSVGTVNHVAVTLIDNDVPELSVSASAAAISEGGVSTITVMAATPPTTDLSVPFTISGTGITAADYTLLGAVGSAVTLPAGRSSVALTLMAADDADAAETLTFMLTAAASDADYAVGASHTATVTITPALKVDFTTIAETIDENGGAATLTIRLSAATADDLVIPVITTDGTATAGADYAALSANVTFTAGAALTQTIRVDAIDNGLNEDSETFMVGFGTLPAGVLPGDRHSVTVTITDDDIPEVSFSTDSVSVAESAVTVTVTVQLDIPPASSLVIPVTATDGTAIEGSDYRLDITSVVFTAATTNAGQPLSTTLTVLIADGGDDEIDETFTLGFGTLPPGVAVGTPATVTVTIIDDDEPELSVQVFPAAISERETSTITITADMPPATDLSVPFTISGTGITAEEYTLTGTSGAAITLPAGETSADLTLTAVNDADTSETLTSRCRPAPVMR